MPRITTLAAFAALAVGTVTAPAHAAAPPLYSYVAPLRVNLPDCVGTVGKAMKVVGLPFGVPAPGLVHGSSGTTNVVAVCVQRPKDGYCGGDGYTAVISAAGTYAGTVAQKILANLRPSAPVDCGGGHGVPHEP